MKKAIITDLSQLRKQEEYKPYLNFAKTIIEEIKQGSTKDEVLHRILENRGGLRADPREMQYFIDMVDIVYEWYFKNKGKESQASIMELLDKMDKNPKHSYKGEDGNYYATRAELEAANGEKNPTRNM